MAHLDLRPQKIEIRVSVTATKKLQNLLDEVQVRSKARTITVQNIRDALDRIPVPKAHLDGTVVYWDGGEKFPSAYKYVSVSTHWVAENVKGKWYITNVRRDTCPNRQSRGSVVYGEAAKQWIIRDASVLK